MKLKPTDSPAVHSVDWYDLLEVVTEITQTNPLMLAPALWPEYPLSQHEKITPVLIPPFEIVRKNAELVGAVSPVPAWDT